MLISVLGAGYVGLVTAACLARLGNEVRCVDVDGGRIERLRGGELPFVEPGLDELVAEGTAAGRLSFHAEATALHGTELAIVAVGTLTREEEWTDDVVRRATLAVVADPRAPRRLVIRSTLLPGTAASIAAAARSIDPAVELAINPEFTREGSAVADFFNLDRVVVGVADSAADSPLRDALLELYAPLSAPVVVTDLTSAEMIKMAANVFLAARIGFANELARLCAAVDADVATVVDGLGMDRRIGRSFLTPGPGFGGSCLPSQARALPALADRLGVRTPLMDAVNASNVEQARWVVEQAQAALGGSVRDRRVCLLGVTFKAGTDDLRESPALRIGRLLSAQGARLVAHDPSGVDATALLADNGGSVEMAADELAAAAGAELVIVATEWPQFAGLAWSELAAAAPGRVVIDTRGVVDAAAAQAVGFEVVSLGRRAMAGGTASPTGATVSRSSR